MKAAGVAGVAGVLFSDTGPEAVGTAEAVDRRGPVRRSRFSVDLELDGTEITGWTKVEMPDIQLKPANYREGDGVSQERKLWGRPEYGPLYMERGVEPEEEEPITAEDMAGTSLYDWHEAVRLSMVDSARRDIRVTLINEQGESIVGWIFHHAWPIQYHPPTLDASARGEVTKEGLTLAYHWYERADP